MILFLGKRHYTGKDTLEERFGRIFHLPAEWRRCGREVMLWLVDYHGSRPESRELDGLPVLSTPVRSLSLWRQCLRMLGRHGPGIVVASGDCYIGLLGWLLARLRGARFVFDVYDKYDEFGGYVRPLGLDLFGFVLRRADALLFASQALAESLGPRGRGDWRVVPNGVDGERFRPMDPGACRRELGLDETAVLVGYFGSMEADRGVVDLIDAVALLRARGGTATLLVCGRRDPSTALEREWIIYRGMVAHALMPAYLNAADVLVVPYRRSALMDMGASCKIAEYLACGRPLASTQTPNLMANFPAQVAELGPALCRAGDPEDLARAIEYQLRERRVASPPEQMLWPAIAASALECVEAAPGKPAHG
jgi:glycosyltransferase involved in cell wall biosynthesis